MAWFIPLQKIKKTSLSLSFGFILVKGALLSHASTRSRTHARMVLCWFRAELIPLPAERSCSGYSLPSCLCLAPWRHSARGESSCVMLAGKALCQHQSAAPRLACTAAATGTTSTVDEGDFFFLFFPIFSTRARRHPERHPPPDVNNALECSTWADGSKSLALTPACVRTHIK